MILCPCYHMSFHFNTYPNASQCYVIQMSHFFWCSLLSLNQLCKKKLDNPFVLVSTSSKSSWSGMVSKIIHLTYPMTFILEEIWIATALTGLIVHFDPSSAKQNKKQPHLDINHFLF